MVPPGKIYPEIGSINTTNSEGETEPFTGGTVLISCSATICASTVTDDASNGVD